MTRELNLGGCAHHYMKTALPNLTTYVKSLNLSKGSVLTEAPRGWEAFAGTAFDRRLRYEYEPNYKDTVTMEGARRLGGNNTEEGRRIMNGLKNRDLDERALYAAVADWEFRSGTGTQTLHDLQEGGESLKQQLINDNQKLMNIARERLSLTKPKFGPTFGIGSQWIGGADGDLINKKCLIDIKCTKKIEYTKFIRQVIAYALLDVENEHDLDAVGIYLARQGILWEIPLREVAKQNGSTLEELRENAPWASW